MAPARGFSSSIFGPVGIIGAATGLLEMVRTLRNPLKRDAHQADYRPGLVNNRMARRLALGTRVSQATSRWATTGLCFRGGDC